MGEFADIYYKGSLRGRIYSRRLKVTDVNDRRLEKRRQEADELASKGYEIERFPLGAYFAHKNNPEQPHYPHEYEACRILAENGLTVVLDPEGECRVSIDGAEYTLASLDGRIEGYTQEIKAMSGKITPDKVKKAIKHSRKQTKGVPEEYVSSSGEPAVKQADVAISMVTKGSKCTKATIADGVLNYKMGSRTATPKFYINIDESKRTVWLYRL